MKGAIIHTGQLSEKTTLICRHSGLKCRDAAAAGCESGARHVNWSGQKRRPWSVTWAFVQERMTEIESAL